ncbi:MAG: D-cysteine desulfhydrase [Proteobacteria bacterium]|nr:D-cysteine desulfhydrase [Pseudomonadota bacterium]
MDISDFPRTPLAQAPTPLEPMPNLGRALGGMDLWIKRDDCTGFALGGNKVRKLEFLIADALAQGASAIVTAGGTQSNHVRQTVAAAARFGLRAAAVLERVRDDALYEANGNALLDRLFGAETSFVAKGTDLAGALAVLAAELKSEGETVYGIPVGGSNALGALGYAVAGIELAQQCRDKGLRPTAIIHASGSGGTQAGLLAGLALAKFDVPVIGFCVSRDAKAQSAKVSALLTEVAGLLDNPTIAEGNRVQCDGNYVGPGYGVATAGMAAAVRLTARSEGIFLDPVYTGKAMAGLIDYAERKEFEAPGPVIFLHTGGTPALFVYPEIADLAAAAP